MRVQRKALSLISPIWRLKLVAMAMSLGLSDQETNTRLDIYSHRSTNPENLVKIALVVCEISLLQSIVKKEDEKESNNSRT